MIALHQNETASSLPYVQSLLSPDLGPAFQVALFFISIFFCHTLTAHFPLTEPPSQGIGRSTSLVLSPISTSVSSFHSVFCVTKRTRLWQLLTLRWPHDHFSNIDTLPLAIRIPVRYRPLVDQNPNVWKPVSKDLPLIDLPGLPLDNNQQPDLIAFHLPATANLKGDRYRVVKQYSYFAKLQALIAFLQLGYSTWQAYSQYQSMFLKSGAGSPVIVALPALYSSFINMIANIIQRTYTHIILIPPTAGSHADTATTIPTTLPTTEPNGTTISCTRGTPLSVSDIDFDDWFSANYPDIELNEDPSLETFVFFAHHILAIIVLFTWLGLLTDFRSCGETGVRQIALLFAVFVDPVLHLLLALLQRTYLFENELSRTVQLAIVAGVKIIIWLANGWGWYIAGKMLFKIYADNSQLIDLIGDRLMD
jgi:hypothetical protein